MPTHDIALIVTLAAGFVLAFVFGFAVSKVSLPPLVGYLLAGVVIGPFTPGFVADTALAGQLAEIGVMLLMFGVGLHFSMSDLMAVRRIAILGAVAQIAVAMALGAGLAVLWGWGLGGGIMFGLCLSVASTVVLLRALDERNLVDSPNGRIAVGWLIVEDLAMVLVLVLLPAFTELLGGQAPGTEHGADGAAGAHGLTFTLAVTLLKVGAFVALAMILGPRVVPWVLRQVARTGSRELFTLAVLAVALGIAYGATRVFGVSFALGAFFAGMVLNGSDFSHKAATNSLPLQDAFAVLFFVSVGMLFDPMIIVREPLMLAGVLLVILIGKTLAAAGIVLVLGYPLSTAFLVAASLAQVGEFSFILGGLGISCKLLPSDGLSLILGGSLFSITFSPLVFQAADALAARILKNAAWKTRFETSRRERFVRIQKDFDDARERARKKAAARKTVSPEQLAERFPLFSGLAPEQREVVALHFNTVEAQPGQRIIRAGDEADTAYFIASGEVEISVTGRKIKLQAGDFFGEMALLSKARRTADVTAIDYTQLLRLSRADFLRFMKKHPDIRDHVTALAHERETMNRTQPPFGETSAPESSESRAV
ncbi:cation:proton antiporter [Termitidicoccus mucosus]|uniref:Cation transporter n=1 Tax=Termitidicoccus mucosus TaxID=1184151 RepID=A0A178IHY4_9BACT|nr:cation transporter [Opitutaceae bacterium TSB47]